MSATVTTFLMFEGKAEEALEFYAGLFEGAQVTQLERDGPLGPRFLAAQPAVDLVNGVQVARSRG
jgi:uncharacterized glyoxalase superfamily protein PhnB